jgi:hypothetical protein
MFIASFDIGKKNFAFCVEEIDDLVFQSLRVSIPKIHRYNRDGTCTPEFEEELQKIFNTGNIVLLENVDLTMECDNTLLLDPLVFVNMNSILTRYKSYWDKCSVIIIEQQMGFGTKINYTALKLGQHCFSYFIFNYANFKQVIEFPSYHKTKLLGAPKKISKTERKKWAVKKALEILHDRRDLDNIKKINSIKKKDDVSDVIVQLQSYKILTICP